MLCKGAYCEILAVQNLHHNLVQSILSLNMEKNMDFCPHLDSHK